MYLDNNTLIYSTTFLFSFLIVYVVSYQISGIFKKNKRVAIIFSVLISFFVTYYSAETLFNFFSEFFTGNIILLYGAAAFLITYSALRISLVKSGISIFLLAAAVTFFLLSPFIGVRFGEEGLGLNLLSQDFFFWIVIGVVFIVVYVVIKQLIS